MDILIVEDDSFKYSRIESFVREVFCDAELTLVTSVHDAVLLISSHEPKKIILDMSLPSHSPKIGEGNPLAMPAGGIEVIMEIAYLKKGHIPIIVLTQYADIQIENDYYPIRDAAEVIKERFGIRNLIVSLYEDSGSDWHFSLRKFLEI